jgi:hypothetical protein
MKSPRLHLWLIRLIGVLVPRRLRADWRQEWEAELRYREALLVNRDKPNRRNKPGDAACDGCCFSLFSLPAHNAG